MAGLIERSEYHWVDGRVVRTKVTRPSGIGRWPPPSDPDNLICIIERADQGIERVFPGAAHTESREEIAVLMEYDLYVPTGAPELGRDIPPRLLQRVRDDIARATAKITGQYRYLANEERTTGALTSDLTGEFKQDGWILKIAAQGFSSVGENSKEPQLGGDFAVIIDISNGIQRLVKAMLVQAKRAAVEPLDPYGLPDLSSQLRKCQQITPESYGWIYSPTGVSAFRVGGKKIAVEDQLVGGLECSRGDSRISTIAAAADRNHVIRLRASGPKQPPPASRRKRDPRR